MAVKPTKAEKKVAYDAKLCQLLEEYTQILVVYANNIISKQLQNIRKDLRGDSIVLMGKNTMMKRSVRMHAENSGNIVFLSLIPLLVVLYMLGDITTGPAFRFTQWLQLVRKHTANYRSSGFPHRLSTTMPSTSSIKASNRN